MNDVNKELNEIMKEFNRHNLDAVVSTNYLDNAQVLHIDTTRHDIEVKKDGYNKACNDMLFVLKEMREATQAMMQPDLEYACDRFIEQVEKLKKGNKHE